MKTAALFLAFLLVLPTSDSTVEAQDPAIYTMVAELRRQSHADALTIKDEYRPLMDTAVFADREHLQRALVSGELVQLSTIELPHVQPRLIGLSPIGQKDLEHQHLYIALRPAAMGMLIDISNRVQRGPLEVTSLVRTAEYQRALTRGNGNANTDVPTHTMGYAVDIGMKFMPADTAADLRRVLEEMRATGDIYFIAEGNQLTIHIVPVPSRMQNFEALYRQTLAEAQASAPAPAPAPVNAAPDTSASRLAGVWSWITNLFD